MKKSRNTKRSKKRRKIRISAVTVWLGLEAVALAAALVTAGIHAVYGDSSGQVKYYSVPEETVEEMSIGDIELPVDLMEENSQTEGITGDLYSADYPEEITKILEGLSPEQKVDMMIIATPEDMCNTARVTIAGDIFKEAYGSHPVTGLVFSQDNFTSRDAGMTMLSTLRAWSRDKTGMNVLIGYRGENTKEADLSDIGINLCLVDPDSADTDARIGEAVSANMIPAYIVPYEKVDRDTEGLYIVKINDPEEAIASIREGNDLLYMTDDHGALYDALLKSANDGTIPRAALDKAAGFAISVRKMLTDMRPEEFEKQVSVPRTASRPASRPAARSREEQQQQQQPVTPEQQAEQAQKEVQKQMETMIQEAQKQVEEAQKAQQNQ